MGWSRVAPARKASPPPTAPSITLNHPSITLHHPSSGRPCDPPRRLSCTGASYRACRRAAARREKKPTPRFAPPAHAPSITPPSPAMTLPPPARVTVLAARAAQQRDVEREGALMLSRRCPKKNDIASRSVRGCCAVGGTLYPRRLATEGRDFESVASYSCIPRSRVANTHRSPPARAAAAHR